MQQDCDSANWQLRRRVKMKKQEGVALEKARKELRTYSACGVTRDSEE